MVVADSWLTAANDSQPESERTLRGLSTLSWRNA